MDPAKMPKEDPPEKDDQKKDTGREKENDEDKGIQKPTAGEDKVGDDSSNEENVDDSGRERLGIEGEGNESWDGPSDENVVKEKWETEENVEDEETEKMATKRESLKDVMARKKREMKRDPEPDPSCGIHVVDPYANSTASNYITRGQTGIVMDNELRRHRCEWDNKYPENPARVAVVRDRIRDKDLLSKCFRIPNFLRTDLLQRIMLAHSPEHYEKLRKVCQCRNINDMESEAAMYDSIYFNRYTFDAANRSVSSVVNLVLSIADQNIMNGLALIRPPGHHAMHEEFNGYCFFNNVAIAAESVIKEKLATKVLIVDIDVHHGQGTQRMFYDRNDVLYFSIHRYEHGSFWPNLRESNFNYIGRGDGLGYNINVPLNATGLSDGDYMAIILGILLPVAYEFNPDLIIVSAGYDAALGCPEGKMNVTPGFYAHLIGLLEGLARGKIAVILEGGYFLPSLAEGVAMTLTALLGGACPILEPTRDVHPSVIKTISNVRRMLRKFWNCFKVCEFVVPLKNNPPSKENKFEIFYCGEPDLPPYQTRSCYPENTIADNNYYSKLCSAMQEKYSAPLYLPVCYVYDDQMLKHAPQIGEVERPERPERLTSIMRTFEEFGIDRRLKRIPIHRRNFTSFSPHAGHYIDEINITTEQTRDVYVNEYTQESIILAVSGLLNIVENMMAGEARAGVAVIRPPGHHAEYNQPMGFCFVNNIAVAANCLRLKYNVQRILIVDFDIHHGNGTQNIFYQDSSVMYISIHRDEDGKFFPPHSARDYVYDGFGPGKGYNINIPFNKDKMGDTEYLAAFHYIVLPAAYAFAPDVVLVSAGFDAGIYDPLGAYAVNPETFGHLIKMLKCLAGGKLILSLEGGYNLTTTSYAMAMCTKALLGDPVIMPKNVYKDFSAQAIQTFRNVIEHFKPYHKIFAINERLPHIPIILKKLPRFLPENYSEELTRVIDPERVYDSEYVEMQMDSLNSGLV